MADCIFCAIVSKETPADLVAENDDAVAFYDLRPQAPTHLLVVPRAHRVSLKELRDEDKNAVGGAQLLIRDLILRFNLKENYKVVVNGLDHGHVAHLHYHLLGGWNQKPLGVTV